MTAPAPKMITEVELFRHYMVSKIDGQNFKEYLGNNDYPQLNTIGCMFVQDCLTGSEESSPDWYFDMILTDLAEFTIKVETVMQGFKPYLQKHLIAESQRFRTPAIE